MGWGRAFRTVSLASVVLAAGCATKEPGRQFPVYFQAENDTLDQAGEATVTEITRVATGSHQQIVIRGQADGGTPHDAQLAYSRGQTVAQDLQAHGVDPSRIQIQPSAPAPGETGVAAHKVVVTLE
jgi:outer membrane protein OmpA-like peptidoglycan-associated protein